MESGKQYLVGLQPAPTIEPKNGGWCQIRNPHTDKKVFVTPVVTAEMPWSNTLVHIFALSNGPDPVVNQDELVYRNEAGDGESRIIMSFRAI